MVTDLNIKSRNKSFNKYLESLKSSAYGKSPRILNILKNLFLQLINQTQRGRGLILKTNVFSQ